MGKLKQAEKISALCPGPGGKRKQKYAMLAPLPGQSRILEAFMGGAARSVLLGLPATLGEINPAQKAIALAPTSSRRAKAYCTAYQQSRSAFVRGIDLDLLLPYAKRKNAMLWVKGDLPEIYQELADRWRVMRSELFASMLAGDPAPGVYSFCQRTAHGNVMRLNPSATNFNVSWSVSKLVNAINFDPESWTQQLIQQDWHPTVAPSWEDAIAAVKKPRHTYALLDPPYIEGEGDRKMTPCYPGHQVTTEDGRDATFALSTDPLAVALERGFPLIHLTNYYSPKLDAAVTALALEAGYLCDRQMLGPCGALGNSAGRLKHGERVDDRPKPIEAVWAFQPFRQLTFFGAAA